MLFRYSVIVALSLGAVATAATPGQEATLPSGRTAYRTLADHGAGLDELAAAHPGDARTFTLPEPSLEGRPVRGIEISRDVANSAHKPVMLLLGLHHGREWPSGEAVIEYATDLLATGDPILDRLVVVAVPVVNPDGFELSRSLGHEMKRKNCRIAAGTLPVTGDCGRIENLTLGVDLNRNYAHGWAAAPNPSAETYPGPEPFSEPETRNIRALVSTRQVTVLITNHTYGDWLGHPGGPEEDTIYKRLSDELAAEAGYGTRTMVPGGLAEHWSYYATAGFGFMPEIGQEFHPVFGTVVRQYAGLRKLYGAAAQMAADRALHAVVTGTGEPGQVLTLTRTNPLAALSSELTVPASGTFEWDINPAIRPDSAGLLTEPWTLTCGDRTFTITAGRGGTEAVDCRPGERRRVR